MFLIFIHSTNHEFFSDLRYTCMSLATTIMAFSVHLLPMLLITNVKVLVYLNKVHIVNIGSCSH